MALCIWKNGEPIYPKSKLHMIDDYGNKWISAVGQIVSPHWKLRRGQDDVEGSKETITKWHLDWQYALRDFCKMDLEVYKHDPDAFGKTKRRADCFHEGARLVIEVQHSKITLSDAVERTNFWESLGYNVIWIFHENILNKVWKDKLISADKNNTIYGWEEGEKGEFQSVRTATKPTVTRLWWYTGAQVYVDYPNAGVSGREHLMARITGYKKLSKFYPDWGKSFLHMTSQEEVKNFTIDVRSYLKQQLQKNNA